ncbi:uncharacterized protein BP01DRAFT_126216 [Aspergillus saccharolyticus JOP 1030-1]|uniref:Uncharacterized protein n=1 Tax=Aspergillus saccharolyticus JOP 1030-1 TaxID=1450539 RepID=A0A318Z6G0_9EURO|nr:hypothetical protein BP01DRAFT_126216 [Aspergillus saccharolyticus JOP 1030-1]PYH42881.1 hypothetical protein BP01DRAFT_126216 [Aspergillus saccharolyticus JOP 1030-1]
MDPITSLHLRTTLCTTPADKTISCLWASLSCVVVPISRDCCEENKRCKQEEAGNFRAESYLTPPPPPKRMTAGTLTRCPWMVKDTTQPHPSVGPQRQKRKFPPYRTRTFHRSCTHHIPIQSSLPSGATSGAFLDTSAVMAARPLSPPIA